LQPGLAEATSDPLLYAERGMVLAARNDLVGAGAAWREALACDSVHPAAYGSLAALALRIGDTAGAQSLVDAVLASQTAHPDVLRRAIQLALATEGEGIARASRVARLCTRLLDAVPGDPWASLALARSLMALGDSPAARERLADIDRLAPASAAAADAQVLRMAIDDPSAEAEIRSVLRAAHTAPMQSLSDVAARARRLATLHGAWSGWLAAAVADRRRQRWAAARGSLEVALELAPGAAAAHLEMATVLLTLEDASAAMEHVERVLAVEGDGPHALAALARALVAAGRVQEARQAAARALALQPPGDSVRTLLIELNRDLKATGGWKARIRDRWSNLWKKK
jgi:tetratricopeptide (TPR) repeat protein